MMDRNLTTREKQFLEALYAARGLKYMTVPELLSAHPETFKGRSPQGLHQTAGPLVRLGYVFKETTESGHVGYHIRTAGVDALKRGALPPMRRAEIWRQPGSGSVTAAEVEAYLPSNYAIIETFPDRIVIGGRDSAGWTLDGYVIPCLASGLITAREIT